MAEYTAPTQDFGYEPRLALHLVLDFAEQFVRETPFREDFRTWGGGRLLQLIRIATEDFVSRAPFPFLHGAVDRMSDEDLFNVGLTPPQLSLKLVAIEAANRSAQPQAQASRRGIRLTYRLLKSLIQSILANIPALKLLADALGELVDNIQELTDSGEP